MLMLSFSISFVYLVVIPLIFCVTPLWHAATAHSPSGKALNSSSQEDPVFQGITPWHTNFTLSCVISLSGTQQRLTHPPVKSSNFPLWKNDVYLGLLLC